LATLSGLWLYVHVPLFAGDELGMLEDMCVVVEELATVQFQVSLDSVTYGVSTKLLLIWY